MQRPNPTFGLFPEIDAFLRNLSGPAALEVYPRDEPGLGAIAAAAGIAAVSGAAAESIHSRVDDNFRIALVAGVALFVLDPLNGATLVSRT